ncbi:MAG: hypothetical protein IT383_28405 [Deltaproteobacteria bacterium]|nr:hypothetical protein [Deltaproteobacteria bacterium]
MHVLVLPLLLAAAQGSVAERLDAARAMADALDYVEAREALLEIRTDERATEDELFTAHLLAGEIDRILERDVEARMHFYWVLRARERTTQSSSRAIHRRWRRRRRRLC